MEEKSTVVWMWSWVVEQTRLVVELEVAVTDTDPYWELAEERESRPYFSITITLI